MDALAQFLSRDGEDDVYEEESDNIVLKTPPRVARESTTQSVLSCTQPSKSRDQLTHR